MKRDDVVFAHEIHEIHEIHKIHEIHESHKSHKIHESQQEAPLNDQLVAGWTTVQIS